MGWLGFGRLINSAWIRRVINVEYIAELRWVDCELTGEIKKGLINVN